MKPDYICMNDKCYKNEFLIKSSSDRPIITLGKKCWNCGEDKYLVLVKKCGLD